MKARNNASLLFAIGFWTITHSALPQAGLLDLTFGTGGIVTTDIGSNTDEGSSMALQPDGKILVAGSSYTGSSYDFAVVRYNADGTLDADFGTGGKVTTAIGSGEDRCGSVLLQPDGRILLGGYARFGAFDFAVVRYYADGTLDTSFGLDGIVTTAITSDQDYGDQLALQPDGRILLSGTYFFPLGTGFATVRYNADGSLDTSFGGDGIVMTLVSASDDQSGDIAVLPDGKILLAGSSYTGVDYDFTLVRLATDGSLDSSFVLDGSITVPIGSNGDHCRAMTVQADGKILLAGQANSDIGYADFALARFNADGSLDDSFSSDGKVITAFDFDYDSGGDVVIQSDGKVLVAGYAYVNFVSDIALVRYTADGMLDNAFGGDGMVNTHVGSLGSGGAAVLVQVDGRILVAGSVDDGTGYDVSVVRYLNDLNIGMAEFTASRSVALVYPNPLANEAVFEYELSSSEDLTCELIDAQGRIVRTLFSNARRPAGAHRETLDLSGISAGQYTVVLSNGIGRASVRVVK